MPETVPGAPDPHPERGVEEALGTLSGESRRAFSTIKAAIYVRAAWNLLNSLIKDSLWATEVSDIDESQEAIEDLLIKTRNQVTTLPDDEATQMLIEELNFDELGGQVGKLLAAKRQILVTEKNLMDTTKIITRFLGKMDEAMLGESTHIRDTVKRALEMNGRLVQRSQLYFAIVGLGSLVLGLGIGFWFSKYR